MYSGKSGYIRAKIVVFGKKWLYSANWWYSGKGGGFQAVKVVLVWQSGCICDIQLLCTNTTTFARTEPFLPKYNNFGRIEPFLPDCNHFCPKTSTLQEYNHFPTKTTTLPEYIIFARIQALLPEKKHFARVQPLSPEYNHFCPKTTTFAQKHPL